MRLCWQLQVLLVRTSVGFQTAWGCVQKRCWRTSLIAWCDPPYRNARETRNDVAATKSKNYDVQFDVAATESDNDDDMPIAAR